MSEKLKTFSQKYFSLIKKIEQEREKIIQQNLPREISKFYKKYGVEPREEDIEQIKKDIVMKRALLVFGVVVVFVFIFMV